MKNIIFILAASVGQSLGACTQEKKETTKKSLVTCFSASGVILSLAMLMFCIGINAQGNNQKQVDMKENVDFSVWPKGEPNAYAQYFTGNSYVASFDGPNGNLINVTFEPRCRNNWHIHHKSVQVLVCVAGRGWYVEEGKDPVEMRPGTVIAIPAEAKHWHGAAKDSWFQHLTYMANAEEGASHEWLDPVTDEEYDKLP